MLLSSFQPVLDQRLFPSIQRQLSQYVARMPCMNPVSISSFSSTYTYEESVSLIQLSVQPPMCVVVVVTILIAAYRRPESTTSSSSIAPCSSRSSHSPPSSSPSIPMCVVNLLSVNLLS